MLKDRLLPPVSEFLSYLASHPEAESKSLPSLQELSREIGIGVPALREQVGVARALGLVEVRPRTGIRRLAYSFAPAVKQSLGYALALDSEYFRQFSDMRTHLETAYWREAVEKLTEEDKAELQALLARAWEKIRSSPVQVPHEEHRKLHLLIYSRLNNPFVTGTLEAYWDAYESVGLNMFVGGYKYLQEVWEYHSKMVQAICDNQPEEGYRALVAHVDLLYHRP